MNKKTIITSVISVAATLIIAFFAIAFYGMSLEKPITSSEAAALIDKGENLEGKLIAVNIDGADTDSTGAIVLNDNAAEYIVYMPNDQQAGAQLKAGDKINAKVTKDTNILGYHALNVDIEK